MRRINRAIAPLMLAMALPLLAAAPSSAALRSGGPRCAQIMQGIPAYAQFPTATPPVPPTLFVNPVTLGAASCKNLTYTATVYSTTGQVLATQSLPGDGTSSTLAFSVPVPGAPSAICGTVTSQSSNGKIIDMIPSTTDTQCATGGYLTLGGGSGASSWH